MDLNSRWLPSHPENRKILKIFILISFFIFFILMANTYYVIYSTRYNEYTVTNAVTLDLIHPDGTIEKNVSPHRTFSPGSHVRIYVPVPLHAESRQYVLAFTTVRTYPQVLWNGHVLSSYDKSRVPVNHNFGALYRLIELPPASYGSTVTIDEELITGSSKPFIGEIFVLPSPKSYTYFLKGEGLLFILYHTLLTLSFSVMLILLCLKRRDILKRGMSISLFVASFILWGLGYHHMLGFWIVSPYINSLIEYGSLYFLPVPFLYYLYLSEKDGRRKRLYHRFSLWFLFLFLAAMALQFSDILTLNDVLPLLHVSILSAGLLVCWFQLHPSGPEKIWHVIVRWGVLMSSAAAALDTLQYYVSNTHSLLAMKFMQALAAWALLIFVLSIALSFCLQLLAQAGEAHEKKTALRMAYHDSLTGLLNHAGIFHA
ncbi:hypothetical protein, partial [Dialister sp.]|uniref:hypothetical protein n=1 Tax=Dialister sp. TaxID=1955814 RepID=UPI003EFD134B